MKKIIIYDFDGTLTPFSMPKFEILEKCGFEDGSANPEFLKMATERSRSKNINMYEALYEVYFEAIKKSGFKLTDDNFALGSNNVTYNNGVPEFLKMLSENGVNNYLLSSGIRAFLRKISIVDYFKDIYATTFNYDGSEATSVDFLMSDKNKVVAVQEIQAENGLSDCSNIIYIGDGLTDYHAMEYVKKNGGTTIFVYTDPNNKDALSMQEVVTTYASADFGENSELTKKVKEECKIPILK